jgi:hypothetical protein
MQEVMVRQLGGRQAWSDEQLDQMIFQPDRTAAAARKRLDGQLASQIAVIDRACKLTDEQKQKLQLAGRGDIKRFFDRYEQFKQKAQSLSRDEQSLHVIQQDINPLRATMRAGLFHDDSLLYKSLPNTLTGDQLSRHEVVAREQRAARHRASIETAVKMLEQGMRLRPDQRRELITLLTNETTPFRRPNTHDHYRILIQLGRLPAAKLNWLFDDAQRKQLDRHLAQYQGLEPQLRQLGLWSDEADVADAARPAARKD